MKREPNWLASSLACFGIGLLVACLTGCTVGQTRATFGASVAADMGSSVVGFDRGYREANPVLGKNALLGVFALALVVDQAAQWCHRHGHDGAAKTLYFLGSGVHLGATSINCYRLTRRTP